MDPSIVPIYGQGAFIFRHSLRELALIQVKSAQFHAGAAVLRVELQGLAQRNLGLGPAALAAARFPKLEARPGILRIHAEASKSAASSGKTSRQSSPRIRSRRRVMATNSGSNSLRS